MVRYLTLIASIISTISVVLVTIFGIIPLMMVKISATQYNDMDQLRESVNIVSIALFIVRIGIILIFISTLYKTNIIMMFGSIGGIFIFVWWAINDIYIRSLLFSSNFLNFMSSSAYDIITVISAILFAIGSLLFYKKSKMMVVAGALIAIYVLFYIFFYSTVVNLIFGHESSNERSIFHIIFYFFEKILFIFAGWYISFSYKSESKKKRKDSMETVFNFDSNIVN